MNYDEYKSGMGINSQIYRISRGVTVRKNSRGTWVVYVEKDNKRKNISFGGTDVDLQKAVELAEAIAKKFREQKGATILGEKKPSSTDFKKYSQSWLEMNFSRWSEATYSRYASILKLFVWPDFRDAKVESINRLHLKVFLQKMLKKRSPATVELIKDVLSGIFEDAVEDGLVRANPTRNILKRILPPRKERNLKSADPFSKEDLETFIATADGMPNVTWAERLVLKVMAYGGLRLGEALAMKAENIDFRSRAFYVTESYRMYRFGPPKKGKRRLVDLPEFVIEELKRYVLELRKKSLQDGAGGEVGLLFLDPTERRGYPYSQRKIQMLMKRVCKAAGLRVRHPHDLRHTYATILLMANKSPAYVQKQLGHYSIQMTVDIYGHWFAGEGRDDLDDAFRVKQEDPPELHLRRV